MALRTSFEALKSERSIIQTGQTRRDSMVNVSKEGDCRAIMRKTPTFSVLNLESLGLRKHLSLVSRIHEPDDVASTYRQLPYASVQKGSSRWRQTRKGDADVSRGSVGWDLAQVFPWHEATIR